MSVDLPGPLRQQELMAELADALVQGLPGQWSSAEYHEQQCAQIMHSWVEVSHPDGTLSTFEAPDEADDAAIELRRIMANPASGAWLSMRAVVQRNGEIEAEFNYDVEPVWTEPVRPDPAMWAQELQFHPRNPERVPAWWRDRIATVDYGEVTGQVLFPGLRIQATLSPTGDKPARQDMTATAETASVATALAAGLTDRGYTVRRSTTDEPDSSGGAEQLDLPEEGGAVVVFDLGAWLSFSLNDAAHDDPVRFWQAVGTVVDLLRDQHGWTLAAEQQEWLDYQRTLPADRFGP